MCVSLVCVLVSFRTSVRAFRVSELLVVRLSFVVKLFRLRLCVCEIPKFSCRISNSYFRVELVVEFRIRIFVSLLYSISRISIFDSSFEFKFLEFSCRISCRISNSNVSSKFLVEFFVSLLYSISRISLWIRCQIRLLEFRFVDSNVQVKCLDFASSNSSSKFETIVEIVLITSTSRIDDCKFVFFIELLNFRSRVDSKVLSKCPILLLVLNWRA